MSKLESYRQLTFLFIIATIIDSVYKLVFNRKVGL